MNHKKKNAQTLVFAGLMGLAGGALATENGAPTTAFGVYDFGAGMMPPTTPNGTVGLRTNWYKATVQKDRRGDDVPNDFSLSVLSLGLAYIRMTDYNLFGARYGFSTVVPFFKMDAEVGIDTPAGRLELAADPFRLADIQVTPLILEWKLAPNLFVNTQFQIQAPTGDYDRNRLVSPGLNHWTFSPMVNATWISETGFEVSSSFQVDFNTRNDATDYKNGTEYRHEFAVGQHFGPWTAGIGGYYYRQFSDDDAPNLTTGNRARVLAVGPALGFVQPGLPAVWLHAYKEFEARNRAEGYAVALRVGVSF
ncbi:transporter [Pseudomonas sp. DTU_2021_1001937_2_SI_NGA_ILE_001]|uniref:SphA family protein n=1 Tax=Pseudomonas sp. DTU_2021_1001937_2_SI_NGA_ILE_001 TaxID=3077589 RepID=UPI0028FC1899|nr:transporter [Pseudomonas sp. DTU_2021_1001937_2_SI_NGA_ILE_001]WNW10030.1 transporter [Pseudomonas sp. DTU_2021_1001937_2_SI_NGA_ILE_001]